MKNAHTTLVFLRDGNQILLGKAKRGFGEGKWNAPGGKLEPNETHEAAMIRECYEEVGVKPTTFEHVATIDFFESFSGSPEHIINYVYLCDKWEGVPVESEEMSPVWFPEDEIPYDSMWPDDQLWLPKVLDGAKLRAEFHIDPDYKVTKSIITELEAI